MLSTKLRTATATAVAALALVGTAVPAAEASKNTGRFQSSVEAKRAKSQLCADLKLIMELAQDQAKAEWEAGNPDGARVEDSTATRAYNDARRSGCGWASRVAEPTSSQTFGVAPAPIGIAP